MEPNYGANVAHARETLAELRLSLTVTLQSVDNEASTSEGAGQQARQPAGTDNGLQNLMDCLSKLEGNIDALQKTAQAQRSKVEAQDAEQKDSSHRAALEMRKAQLQTEVAEKNAVLKVTIDRMRDLRRDLWALSLAGRKDAQTSSQ